MSTWYNLSFTLPVTTPASNHLNNTTTLPTTNSSKSWDFQESPMFHFLINVLATIQSTSFTPTTTNSTMWPDTTTSAAAQHDLDYPLDASFAPTAAQMFQDFTALPNGASAMSINDTGTPTSPHSPWEVGLIVIAGGILSILTFSMNLMVMISFKVDRQLQTISNYFLFSLAVADFTIGLISIPLMTAYTAMNEWTLGYELCQFWLCVDYLMSNASVYNLLLISFDRYFSVTRPLTYRPRRTKKKALVMIASTYIISLILWPPWIISWPYIEGQFVVASNACMVQFLQTNPYVTIGTIIAAFYLPVTIMIILYARVYYETQKRQQEFSKLQAFHQRSHYRSTSQTGLKVTASRSPAPSNSASRKTSAMTTFEQSDGVVIRNNAAAAALQQHPALVSRHSSRIRFNQRRISEVDETCGYANSASRLSGGRLKTWITRFFFITKRSQENSMHSSTLADFDEESFSSDSRVSCMDVRGSTAGISLPDQASLNCSLKTKPSKKRSRIITDPDESIPMLRKQKPSLQHRASIEQCNDIKKPDDTTYTVLIKLEDSEGRQVTPRLSEVIIDEPGPKVTIFENQQAVESNLNTGSASKLPGPRMSLALPDKNTLRRQRSLSDTSSLKETQVKELRKQWSESATANSSQKVSPNLARKRPGSTTHLQHTYSKGSLLNNTGMKMKTRSQKEVRKNNKKSRTERKQESKAAKTLSAILLAFILTWTPYSIIIVIEAFKPGTVPAQLWNLSYYLCYINSTVNPLCYALCNATFRSSYIRIVTCKWRSPRSAARNRALGRSTGGGGAQSGFFTR